VPPPGRLQFINDYVLFEFWSLDTQLIPDLLTKLTFLPQIQLKKKEEAYLQQSGSMNSSRLKTKLQHHTSFNENCRDRTIS
jgi:hypothetical protein